MTTRSTPPSRGLRLWLPWLAMAAVVLVTLGVGTLGGGPRTEEQRIRNIESTLRCPQCSSQSVANSDTPSSQGVKVVVRERVAAGDSDEQIRDFVAAQFGREVLLYPSGRGFGAVVWAVPVVAGIVALAALVLRFRDWRPSSVPTTDADRDLVAVALEDRRAGGPAPAPARLGDASAGSEPGS